MDKKEEHLSNFRHYYNTYSKELNDDLKKLEDIEDVVKKYWEVYRMFSKYELQEINMINSYISAKNLGGVDNKYFVMHQEYSKKVCQLKKTKIELAKIDEVKKDIEKRKKQKPISETSDQSNLNRNEEIYYCDECTGEKKGRYLYHKTKNDGKKFCSTNCYQEFYGEYCSKCVNENKNFTKYLNVIQDKDNAYCRTCYKIVEKEQEQQKEKGWNPNIYCRYCSAKSELFDVCDKRECLAKINQEIESKKKNKNTNSNFINNNSHIREREREREREQISMEQQQLLSQIMNLEQNPNSNSQELDSKKQQLKDLETKSKELIKPLPLDTQITILQKEIKVLESKPTKNPLEKALLTDKKKELAELLSKKNSSNTNNDKPSDKTALIVGSGIIGIVLIGLVVILTRKSKNKKH